MNTTLIIIGCASTAVLAMLVALWGQRRQCRRLRRQLAELQEQVTCSEPEVVETRPEKPFAADLEQAALSRQEPRPHRRETTERYRYISAMARQGMSPAQIAAALEISEVEATQIVRLVQRH